MIDQRRRHRPTRAERGFGFLRDTRKGGVFFLCSAVPPADGRTTLEVGMAVECEVEPGPKGHRPTKITIVLLKRRSTGSATEP
jgi:cold shock CspA family protein